MSFMSHSAKKQAIQVGILEISSQNKAILEYFFSDAGKSYFKEVSLEDASAYIIDYDSLGAKESWSSTYEETKKPGIIISIKEVDLPSTIWLQKPLTVKALKDAGESIRDMIIDEEASNKVTAAVIKEVVAVEEKEEVDVKEEITQEIIEEKNQDDANLLDDLLIDEIIDIPNEPTSEILFDEKLLETSITKSQEDIIDIVDLPEVSVKKELVADTIEETIIKNTEKVAQVAMPEETLQLDNLLIDEFLETPKNEFIDSTPKEAILKVETDNNHTLVEPELALAETDTSFAISASPTDYATSENFVDIDLSLEVDTANDSTDNNHNTEINIEPEFIPPLASTDTTENLLSSNDDMDSMLESLISGGEDSKKTNNIITDLTEDEAEAGLLDFDLENNDENEENIIDTRAEYIDVEIEAKDVAPLEATAIADLVIEKNLQNKTSSTKQPEKSAEEELQSLLEEIRQEADVDSQSTNSNSSKGAHAYSPTDAEERWKLICGTNIDSVDIQKLASFEPSNHILSTIVQNVEIAKQNKETIRVKFKGIIVVIDPETDNIFCDRSILTEFYANICFEPIKKDNIKIHNLDASELRLYRKKMQEDNERTHSIEAFIWTTSLLTSRGRLPKMTNIKSKVGLNSWPNLTRVENIPHMMQIAALFHKNTWSLLEISNKSGVAKKYVIAFYNAALALNMIETNGASISSASLDLKKSDNKNRSLFSRFLKKITA